MIESLFFLDKLVIKTLISYFSNSITMFSSLCGVLLVTQIYSTEKKNKNKRRK